MQPNEKSWWFVYGPGRSGTSYFSRLFASSAERLVSDWGLGPLLATSQSIPRLDQKAFLADLYKNIYANTHHGYGTSIGIIFKQANTSLGEYKRLREMLGEPERIVFMLREPSSYIASAKKKFSEHSIEHLSTTYAKSLNLYFEIGGDVILYGPELSKESVGEYLEEIDFRRTRRTNEIIGSYANKGERADDLVSKEMNSAFSKFFEDDVQNFASLQTKHYVIEEKSPEGS